ncbi:MAG: type IV secretion protein Rhs [Gammaproteobacteria bacterium]|nr:type IV secretion protein Rhs [Gammaproteobacteria bacterium]
MRVKLVLFLVGVSFLAACARDDKTSHVDPAPLPADVSAKMTASAASGRPHPLPETLNRQLEETSQLLQQFESTEIQKTFSGQATDAAPRQFLIASKRQELKVLRDEIKATFVEAAPESSSVDLRLSREQWQQVENRFDRLDRALEKIENSRTSQERVRAIAAAMADLAQVHAKAHEHEEGFGDGPIPTFQTTTPVKPEPQPESKIPPAYASYKISARESSGHAFAYSQTWLRKTLANFIPNAYAGAPDPIPAEAASCGYTAVDLAQNEEVQITQEIRDLAEKLEYSPARIFQWVSNEIKFEPYYGSLKGALGTLYAKAGGSTDQASLLIALLRASNIPARYVKGQIQVNDETPLAQNGRGPRWIGAKSYGAAANILGQGRNPSYGIINNAGGQAIGVNLAHVWVQACVPYGNYRGIKIDKSGHRWIPLDPSFKDKSYQAGIQTNVNFDYSGAPNTFMARRSNQLPHEYYETQVEGTIKASSPWFFNNTLGDVPYKGTALPVEIDILPVSLPYEVTSFLAWDTALTAETAALPDKHRYKFDITVMNGAGGALGPVATLSMPATALNRMTLSFKGATATDQTALDAWRNDGNVNSAAPCAINVIPSLKVEGGEIAAATGAVGLCTSNNRLAMTMRLPELSSPTINSVTYTNIGAANYHALQGYAFQASDRLLTERAAKLTNSVRAIANPNTNLEETEGEFLHVALLKYMRYITDAGKRIGAIDGGSGESGNHIGLTSTQMKVQYLFDLPFSVYRRGLLMDVLGGQSRSVDLTTGGTIYKSFLLSGYSASNYESYIWQENARSDAVSTVRGIQFARENGIEVISGLTSANWATHSAKFTSNANPALNYSVAQVNSIKTNYIDQGFTLTIPRSLIQYDNWRGAVFVAERNNLAVNGTASVGYIISGGYAGGYTTAAAPSPLGSTWSFPSQVPSSVISSPLNYSYLNSTTAANGTNNYISFRGDPVNMATGNMYHTERDITIKGRGGLPVVFERSYNSRDPKNGPLGFGWTHSFNHYLRFYGVEGGVAKVSWVDGTGGEKFFATAAHTSGNINLGSTLPKPAGIFVTFQRLADGSYQIREKSGLTYAFENINATATDTGQKARLLSIRDRNNNVLTLAYDGSGRLATVSDGLSRSLTFTYDASNRISQLSDWTGRQFQYGYDAAGNLASFKNPLAVAGSQPPVTYAYYGDPQLNHAMSSYTLPNGNGMTFEYYMNGKVFRHYTRPLRETTTFTYNDFRRESVTVNERGFERRFFFDEYGNPVKIVEENGATRTYTYDTANPFNRLSKTDPMGNKTQYAYDANGNVTQITNPSSGTVAFSYFTAFNQPGKVKDARGNYALYKYDATGNLLQDIRLKAGVGSAIDPVAYVPAAADLKVWIINTYDTYGNLASAKRVRDFVSGAGYTLTFNYDANRLNVASLSRSGDKNGDGVIDAADASPTMIYDPLGRPTTDLDADWQAVTKVYDAVDRITRMTDAVGQPRDYKYDANGNAIDESLTTGAGLLDRHSARYDASDRKIANIDAGGNVTAWAHDNRGNITRITNPDNYSVAMIYDEADRVLLAYDQTGRAVSTTRDPDGKPRTVTDPNGNTVTYTWWDNTRDGRLKRTQYPKLQSFAQGRAVDYDYDANGNLTSVSDVPADGSAARVTLTQYDELNRPVRIAGPAYTDAALGTIRPLARYSYDNLGNLANVEAGRTDASGTNPASDIVTPQMIYAYDDFGRKIRETDPLGKARRFEYDLNNNLTKMTDARGQVTTWAWAYGHQLRQRSTPGQYVGYSRNALGQVLTAQSNDVTYSYTYDAAQRLQSLTDSRGNKRLSYAWSPGGQLNRLTDSDGRVTVYQYDPAGRLSAILAPNRDRIAFAWDAGGRLSEKWFPNGLSARYIWNPDNSLKQLVNRSAASTVLTQHDYSYDGVGNRIKHIEAIAGAALTYDYAYDPLSRLTQAKNGNAAQQEDYSYDPLNNRTRKTVNATTPVITAYTHDAANQLTEVRQGSPTGTLLAGYVYDANGNLLKKCEGGTVTTSATTCTGASVTDLSHDGLDRLIRLVKTGQPINWYRYDDQGRRTHKAIAGVGEYRYVYNGPDIHAEYFNQWNTARAVYTHGPNIDDPLIRMTITGSNTYGQADYYHQDGLGSVVALSNNLNTSTQTQRFDAWGNKLGGTIAQAAQYGYTGREPDETGLVYYRARYYDPGIARFIQRDPMGFGGGDINLYAYVGNNPVNNTDPTGEVILNAVGAGWGLVSGGISGGIAAYNTTGGSWAGTGLGIISGGFAGAAVGAVNPAGSIAAGQVIGGTVGGVLGNIGNTTLTQVVNSQPTIRPLENLTAGTFGTSFLSGAMGAAGTSAVRMGAAMVNSGAAGSIAVMETIAGTSAARVSTSLVINPSGNVLRGASAIAGGVASGTMRSSVTPTPNTSSPGPTGTQSFSSPASPMPTGTQTLPSFSTLGPSHGSGGIGTVRPK